jgi:hypothetical protein
MLWINEKLEMSFSSIISLGCLIWIISSLLNSTYLNEQGNANPWKYVIGPPLSIAILAITSNQRYVSIRWITPWLLVLVSLKYEARGMAIIVSCVGLIDLINIIFKSIRAKIFCIVCVVVVGFFSYPIIAVNGLLGNRVKEQQIYNITQGNNLNYVLPARIELPQNLYLAMQHPVTGIGVYSSISQVDFQNSINFIDSQITPISISNQQYLLRSNTTELGYKAHSQIGASFLFGGVLTLFFWVFLITLSFKLLFNFAFNSWNEYRSAFLPLLFFLWDIFFSALTRVSQFSIAISFFCLAFSAKNVVLTKNNLKPARLR